MLFLLLGLHKSKLDAKRVWISETRTEILKYFLRKLAAAVRSTTSVPSKWGGGWFMPHKRSRLDTKNESLLHNDGDLHSEQQMGETENGKFSPPKWELKQ